MPKGFLKHINNLVNESDFIIEVLDARWPEKTRNFFLEKNIREKNKQLLFVINKADLITKEDAENKKDEIEGETKCKTIFISALEKDGINIIRKEISIAAKKKKNDLIIGIIGYPNTGKSSLINALAGKGKGRAATSRKAGLTRGLQRIKIGDGLYLIDSPGIIPQKTSEIDLFLVNSKNPNQLKDIEGTAVKVIHQIGLEKIAKRMGIADWKEKDEEELLEAIAQKQKFFLKGAKPDTMKAARYLLEKYQKNDFV